MLSIQVLNNDRTADFEGNLKSTTESRVPVLTCYRKNIKSKEDSLDIKYVFHDKFLSGLLLRYVKFNL